ncbi:MAG: UDP-N-acetylmuramate--L-alanine ligase [Gammaproteobacteria bacterium]|nr:UDP-N-acetylmuramate--L-alanine ligase [Gammaproteobacteria bacterium]
MNNSFEQIKNLKRIHFVGIGGSGMYGIAEVLLNLGCTVSGSDLIKSTITKRLKSLGVKIYSNHSISNLKNVDLVVFSNAINKNNPEIQFAKKNKITAIPRAKMLAELMRFKYGITVAGSHGKSTTTSLISWILAESNLDPTYIVGGKLKTSNNHGRLGYGKYLIAEADESDSSFLYLSPQLGVVTNIDKEHLDNYQNNFENLKQAYIDYINNIPFYGRVFLNGDDKNTKSIMKKTNRSITTFGLKQNNDYFSTDIVYHKNGMSFIINDKNSTHTIKTKLFGKHNILNILASFSVASYLKIPIEKIIKAIKKFEGITRRFDIYYNFQSKIGEYTLINDYGHHPTEINFTLDTIKEVWKNQKICMIFQPHRYSRTENCIDQFIQVLSNVEKVIITETYSGGEQKTKFTSYYLYKKLKENHVNCEYVKEIKKIPQKLKSLFEKEDIVLVQGAGNISQVIKLL